jgi:hypothetical protein
MTKLEKLEREIRTLAPDDVRKLADFIAELRADLWDAQIESDAKAGKLDRLAEAALAAHRAGKTTPL